jgi:hypothetical protein
MIRHKASADEITYIRKAIIATGLAVAVLSGLTSLAWAQTSMSAASPRSGATAETTGQRSGMYPATRSPMQAPVGHFQPSPRELPGLANENISRTPEQIDADKNLRICRGC